MELKPGILYPIEFAPRCTNTYIDLYEEQDGNLFRQPESVFTWKYGNSGGWECYFGCGCGCKEYDPIDTKKFKYFSIVLDKEHIYKEG